MPDFKTGNERKIVLFTFVSHFLFHFYEIAFPVLAIPLTLSLQMDLKDVLALGFPMYLLFGLFALPWGVFADHFSNRTALIISFFGTAAGAVLTALSSTPTEIMGSLAVVGVFSCICHPAGMGLISHGCRSRGAALGVFSIAGSIGLIAGPFLAGLLNWLAGWKIAYLAMGIFGLLWGVAMVLVHIDETPLDGHETPNNAGEANAGNPIGRVVLFFWIVTLGGLAYRINIVSLPALLEFEAPFLSRFFHSLHIPDIAATTTMAAALLTSLVYAVGVIGQLCGGRLADRHDLRPLYLVFNAVSLPCVILMAFLGEQLLVFASAAYVFFALGIQPIENSLIAHFTPRKWRSTGYGLAAILIFGVGALAVYLVGWVSARWLLGAVYLFSAGLVVLIVAHILWLLHGTKGMIFRNNPVGRGPEPET